MSRLVEPQPVLNSEGTPPGKVTTLTTYALGVQMTRLHETQQEAFSFVAEMLPRNDVSKIVLNHKLPDDSAVVAIRIEKRIFPRQQPGLVSRLLGKFF